MSNSINSGETENKNRFISIVNSTSLNISQNNSEKTKHYQLSIAQITLFNGGCVVVA